MAPSIHARPMPRDTATSRRPSRSLVSAPLLAVLRHAALDRLPDATPGLPQGLPRLLGELRGRVRPTGEATTLTTVTVT